MAKKQSEDESAPARPRSAMDLELLVMRRICVMLDKLEIQEGEAAVTRVVQWVAGKYASTPRQPTTLLGVIEQNKGASS